MTRLVAFAGALLLAFISVSSACLASSPQQIHFFLEMDGGGQRVHATFHESRDAARRTNWSDGFSPGELVGLDLAGFRAGGTRPLRFALIREAGRLDCTGQGGSSTASGNCAFTADPAFAQLLAARGIGRPTRDQSFGLMAVNARRDLIDGIAAARYPTPTVDDLMALSALKVSRAYIDGLARAGYRPSAIHSLIEFKALGITPDWIGGFARIGYGNLPPSDLVQLRALGINPAFVSGFDQAGYRHLPVNTLVQLKALNITPEFVRSVAAGRSTMPPVNELVEMKLFGRKR